MSNEEDDQLDLFEAPAPKKRQVNAKMRRSFSDVDPETYAAKRVVRHRRQRFIRWLRLIGHRCASCGGPIEVDGAAPAKRARPPAPGLEEPRRLRPEAWLWLSQRERGEAPQSLLGLCDPDIDRVSCRELFANVLARSARKPEPVAPSSGAGVVALHPHSSGDCVVWRAPLVDPPELPKTCARCLGVDSAYKKSSVIVAQAAKWRDELGRPMLVKGNPRMLPVYGQRYDGDGDGWDDVWPVCAKLSECLAELVTACRPKDPAGASCPKDCGARDVGTPETQMPRRR